jgi:hypothetical protein
MWDKVLPAWVALLQADAELMAALGGAHIYPAQAATAVRIPSVEWLIVNDRETELFNEITVQVDFWARGTGRAATIESRLRMLTHRDTSRELGGMRMWTRYLTSRTHQYNAEPGVTHRSLDFLFEPLREKYLRPSAPEL